MGKISSSMYYVLEFSGQPTYMTIIFVTIDLFLWELLVGT